MHCRRWTCLALWLPLVALGCTGPKDMGEPPLRTAPGAEADGGNAPPAGDAYRVKLTTTKGDVLIDVHPEWSPRGAVRFRELVEAGFYDGCKFFRVLDGFMAQTGINGDPEVNAKWREDRIEDDPVVKSNTRGFVSFATSGPDSRTTQFFINYGDNSQLDGMGFSPFGEVVEGMDVVDKLYNGYGEGAPRGPGPDQGRINEQGNAYLEEQFPKLDAIEKATIASADEPASPDEPAGPNEP
jgi:peptidyl-prolyl cis-trans isomerase A (cyclophilin A)